MADFSKSSKRDMSFYNYGDSYLNACSVESVPQDRLNRDSIGARSQNARSVLAFDKRSERDDLMYNTKSFSVNIKLENGRDER